MMKCCMGSLFSRGDKEMSKWSADGNNDWVGSLSGKFFLNGRREKRKEMFI